MLTATLLTTFLVNRSGRFGPVWDQKGIFKYSTTVSPIGLGLSGSYRSLTAFCPTADVTRLGPRSRWLCVVDCSIRRIVAVLPGTGEKISWHLPNCKQAACCLMSKGINDESAEVAAMLLRSSVQSLASFAGSVQKLASLHRG